MDFSKNKVGGIIKILGVYFSYDLEHLHDLNFTETLKEMVKPVKTFAVPKLMYKASVTELLKDLVKYKGANSILYG